MAGSTTTPGSSQTPKPTATAKKPGSNTTASNTTRPKTPPEQTAGSIKPPTKIAGSNSPPQKTAGSNTPPPKKASPKTSPEKGAGSENTAANADKRPSTLDNNGSDSRKRLAAAESTASGSSQAFCAGSVAMRLFTRDRRFPTPPDEKDRVKPGPLADERTKFAMAHCFHLALALLERSTGHDAFIKVAKSIVKKRRVAAEKENKPEAGLFAGKKLEEMPTYVNDFLKKVRTIGLPVCVSPGVKGNYGITQRWTWGFDMAKYEPEKAAVIYLNKGMIEGLLEAADAVNKCMAQQSAINAKIQPLLKKAEDPATKKQIEALKKDLEAVREGQKYAQMSFERAIFCMSVTLAHEFVHCFTGYLSGRGAVGTPPDLPPYGPYGTDKRGEAGWDWCRETFSGLAHFWYTKGAPEPLTSGYYIGIPVLLDVVLPDWQKNSKMYQVDHAMVKKIIEMKDWESAYKADPNWMQKVRKQGDKGMPYLEWKKNNNDVVKIWDKYWGIPDVDSATAIAMGSDADLAFAGALKPVPEKITKPLAATDPSLRKTAAA